MSIAELIWVEKYRPAKIDEIIDQEEVKERIKQFLKTGNMPHLLFYGPPGTGKTLLVTSLARMSSLRAYVIQLHKFMTDVEIFGPYNIRALQDGRLVRVWSPIITAELLYFDEVFNAPGFLLNAMNSLLNERVIFDPFTGEVLPVRAVAIYASSNYIPQSQELMAFADRFPIKVTVDYVAPEFYEDAYNVSLDGLEPPSGIIGASEVEELRKMASEVLRDEGFRREYLTIAQGLAGLREFGVRISDRTLFAKLPRIIASLMVLLECPPSQKGCPTYVTFLVLPWVINANIPEEYKPKMEDSIKDSLKMARNDFVSLMSAIRAFLRYEVKALAIESFDITGFENTISESEDLLKYQRWYSFLVDFLEWRSSWLAKKSSENASVLGKLRESLEAPA